MKQMIIDIQNWNRVDDDQIVRVIRKALQEAKNNGAFRTKGHSEIVYDGYENDGVDLNVKWL